MRTYAVGRGGTWKHTSAYSGEEWVKIYGFYCVHVLVKMCLQHRQKNFLGSLEKLTHFSVENFYDRFQFLDFIVAFQVTVEESKTFMERM